MYDEDRELIDQLKMLVRCEGKRKPPQHIYESHVAGMVVIYKEPISISFTDTDFIFPDELQLYERIPITPFKRLLLDTNGYRIIYGKPNWKEKAKKILNTQVK